MPPAIAAHTPEPYIALPPRPGREAEHAAANRFFARERRLVWGPLMPALGENEVELLFAKLVEELQPLSDAEKVKTLVETDAWKRTVGAECQRLWATADKRRAYSYFELECVLLFGRLLGKRTVRETLAALSGYKAAKTREEFGLDRPRDHVKTRYVKREDNLGLDGVPSEATMSRHIRKRFPEKLRTKLYLQCFLEIVIEHAEKYPEFAKLLEALGADGSVMKSRHHPRMRTDENGNIVYDPDTGEVSMIPEGWDGGSLTGKSSDPEHKRPPAYLRGHGQMCVTVHTPDALPVGVEIGRLGADHETNLLLKIVEEQLPRLRKTMRPEAVPTVTTDGGFASQRTRRGLSMVGFVANSHDVGHGDAPNTENNVQSHRRMVFEIEGHPEWRANGMREIFCMCGEGHVSARYSKTKNGQQKTAVEGACKNCGPIRITADDWRVAKVPSDSTLSGRFVRIDPGDEHERNEADCQFGNPLTHGDKRAELLGKQRRAQGEGHFGTMTVGYNLFEEDNRHVRLDQARIEVYLTYCLVHALSMEVRRQRAAGAAKPQLLKVRRGPPPGPRPRAIAA